MMTIGPGGFSRRFPRVIVVALLAAVLLGGVTMHAAEGYLDPSFGTGGIVTTDISNNNDAAKSVAIQPDGMIVVAGSSGHKPQSNLVAARYEEDGTLDTNFGVNGIVTTTIQASDFGNSVAIQPDGMVVVVGGSCNLPESVCYFAVTRYTITGTLDSTFGAGGIVTTAIGNMSQAHSVIVQSDGRIVAVGNSWSNDNSDFAVARYDSNGNLDTSFGLDGIVTTTLSGVDYGYSGAIQSDGKIVVAGTSESHFAVARYTVTGTLDSTFGSGGIVTTTIDDSDDATSLGRSVVLLPNDKIIVAGSNWSANNSDFAVVRYHSNGDLDTSFGSGGIVVTDLIGSRTHDEVYTVALQPDGRIIVGGTSCCPSNDLYDLAIVRYLSDGSPDSSFGIEGVTITSLGIGDEAGRSVAIQPDGNIVLVGYTYNGKNYDFIITRYLVFQHKVYLPVMLKHQ